MSLCFKSLTLSISHGVSTDSDIQCSFYEGHYVMVLILVREAAEFPKLFSVLAFKMSALKKHAVKREIYSSQRIFNSFKSDHLTKNIRKNDKWPLGCLKTNVLLYIEHIPFIIGFMTLLCHYLCKMDFFL